MSAITVEQVLTSAEKLSADEQEMLTDLLQKRRIESWREENAAEAKRAAKAYRAGKLKAESADAVIAQLRSELKQED
jgi:hypothetical protein